jgi:uncharacterized protein YpmS
MEDFNYWPLVLIGLISLLVQLLFIIVAIRLAIQRERTYFKIQTRIMIKMAKKAGVSEEELDKLFIEERIKILT